MKILKKQKQKDTHTRKQPLFFSSASSQSKLKRGKNRLQHWSNYFTTVKTVFNDVFSHFNGTE